MTTDNTSLLFITPAHPLYPEELELRFRVLREPLGYTRAQVAFPFEEERLHLVARREGAVEGEPLTEVGIPHRQMAKTLAP